MELAPIKAMLIAHEGVRHFLYRDSMGQLTGGVGHDFAANGLSPAASDFILTEDINVALAELESQPWWSNPNLTDNRKLALIDMMFNLGAVRFRKFARMVAAIAIDDFDAAAHEMLDSAWATQVGQRAKDDAEKMRRG